MESTVPEEALIGPEIGLREYLQILLRRRWWFIATFLAVVGAVAIYCFAATPIYEAAAKLLVETGQKGGGAQAGDVLGDLMGMARARTIETQIELIKSATVMGPALEAAGLTQDGRTPRIKIQGLRDTDIVTIVCQSPNPQLAARLANAIAEEYVQMSLVRNRQVAQKGREFVEQQLAGAENELQETEQALKEFREQSGVTAVGEAVTSLITRMQAGEERTSELRAAVAADRAEMAALRRRLGSEHPLVVASQTLVRNPLLDSLRADLGRLEAERASLAPEFAPTSQRVKAVERRIKEIRDQMAREVERVVSSESRVNPVESDLRRRLVVAEVQLLADQERSAAADRALAETRTEVKRLPEDQRKAAELQRAVTVAENRYLALIAKQQDLRLAEESEIPGASVIEYAQPPDSYIKPNKNRNLLLAVFLGLLLAWGLALLVNYLDDTFASVEEVERDLGLPVLTIVYYLPRTEQTLLSSPLGKSPFAESFRMLRSGLRFSGVKRPFSTLVVTSPGVGEGKSTVALNLAIASAEGGQRTILVDSDLRRPALHNMLGLAKSVGLTNCLVNGAGLEEALQPTQYPNLSFLASGPLPPNPGEVLDSEAMQQLIAKLGEMADLVIFDSPPAMMLADAEVLGRACDATLLVMEIEATKRPALRRLVDVFSRDEISMPGIVVNKARRAPGSYYYYYYYYSHYYGDEEEEEESEA